MRLSHQEREERHAARTDEFKSGEVTEVVYRASLFALGYRGDDIDMNVRQNRPALDSSPGWIRVVARAVAVKAIQERGGRDAMGLHDWERFVEAVWKDNQCAR